MPRDVDTPAPGAALPYRELAELGQGGRPWHHDRMKKGIGSFLVSAIMVLAAGLLSGPLRAENTVDLQLVLAVDVSLSMDLDEQRLQRDGYVEAFRSAEVWQAIASGPNGRIGVTYIEWAGAHIQETVLPWTLIDGPEAAVSFAAALAGKPISRARMTSISGVLDYAEGEFEVSPFRSPRRVIDVSGDGPNNSGGPVSESRDRLVAKGIVINGLPIILKTGGPNSSFDLTNLDRYYIDCVIGGPGSFSLAVRDRTQFAATIRRKLILEISELRPLRPQVPHVHRVQAAPTQNADCLAGEKRWEQYLRGRFRE